MPDPPQDGPPGEGAGRDEQEVQDGGGALADYHSAGLEVQRLVQASLQARHQGALRQPAAEEEGGRGELPGHVGQQRHGDGEPAPGEEGLQGGAQV